MTTFKAEHWETIVHSCFTRSCKAEHWETIAHSCFTSSCKAEGWVDLTVQLVHASIQEHVIHKSLN